MDEDRDDVEDKSFIYAVRISGRVDIISESTCLFGRWLILPLLRHVYFPSCLSIYPRVVNNRRLETALQPV